MRLSGPRFHQDFHDWKSTAWRREQDEILRKLERYQNANRSYLDEGVKILELAQRAVILYEKQTEREKRRIIKLDLEGWPSCPELQTTICL